LKKRNILFVSHEATRTGAPIVLLNLLKWLTKKNKYNFFVAFRTGGDLIDQFRQISSISVLESNLLKRSFNKLIQLLTKTETKSKLKLPNVLKRKKFDLIYLNTVLSLDIAAALKGEFGCSIICHIHENEFAISFLNPNGIKQDNINIIDRFIVVSQSTKNNLVDNYGIPPDKIIIIYAFIPIDDLKNINKSQSEVSRELKLNDDFIVGGAGDCNWRKGIDLFIQLAVMLNKLRPDNTIKLVWVGRYSYEFECQYQYELKRLQISDKVVFTGQQAFPQDYFQIYDVFALTSREDPFPLVVLEVASMEKPIVFFNNAGGVPELFVNNKGGIKVPFGNIEEMASAILFLFDNPDIRKGKGKEAAELIKNYDINIIGPQLEKLIDELI